MKFSLLDSMMNYTYDGVNFIHLT